MSLLSTVRLPTIVSCITLIAGAAMIGLLVDFDDGTTQTETSGSSTTAAESVAGAEVITPSSLSTTTTTTLSTTTTEREPPPPAGKESSSTTTAGSETATDRCGTRESFEPQEGDEERGILAYRGDETAYPTNATLVLLHPLGSDAQKMLDRLVDLCDLAGAYRTILVLQGWETTSGQGLGWAADEGSRGVTEIRQLTNLIKTRIEDADGVVFIGEDDGAAMALRASCWDKLEVQVLGSIIRAPVLHKQSIASDGQYGLCDDKHPVYVQTVEPTGNPLDDYFQGSAATSAIFVRWGCVDVSDCDLVEQLGSDAPFIDAVLDGLSRIAKRQDVEPPPTDSDEGPGEQTDETNEGASVGEGD